MLAFSLYIQLLIEGLQGLFDNVGEQTTQDKKECTRLKLKTELGCKTRSHSSDISV